VTPRLDDSEDKNAGKSRGDSIVCTIGREKFLWGLQRSVPRATGKTEGAVRATRILFPVWTQDGKIGEKKG